MNRALTAAALEDTACNALATNLGGGLLVNAFELALLGSTSALESTASAVEFMKAFAGRKGRTFNTKERNFAGPEDLDAFLQGEIAKVQQRVNVFRSFGLLPDDFKVKG